MALLSLLVALAGTPLRFAEAADDMACSLGEVGGGDVIEVPDGGVGDDSGVTIGADVAHPPIAPTTAEALPGSFTPPARAILHALARRDDRPTRAGGGLPRRLAMLQCFLC